MKIANCCLLIILCFNFGCSSSRETPVSCFEQFVQACILEDEKTIKKLLTPASWNTFSKDLLVQYGSMSQGLRALSEQTKREKPMPTSVEPVKKHLLEKVHYQVGNRQDYLLASWEEDSWKLVLAGPEVERFVSAKEIPDFTPKVKP